MYDTGIFARKRWSQYEEAHYLLFNLDQQHDDKIYLYMKREERWLSHVSTSLRLRCAKKMSASFANRTLILPQTPSAFGNLLWMPIKYCKQRENVLLASVLRIRPGSGAFLTPGSGIGFPDHGFPTHIYESLVTIFSV
jgi:hypothetical protein